MQNPKIKEETTQISDSTTVYLNDKLMTVIERVDYIIERRCGFTSIFSDSAAKKSYILDFLKDKYQSNPSSSCITVFMLASHNQTGFAFLKQLCSNFGLELKYSFYDQYKILETWLLEQYHNGKNIVIFINDAENLKTCHLDVLRSLIKFEPFYEKIVQVILIGNLQLKSILSLSKNKDLFSRMISPSTIIAPDSE